LSICPRICYFKVGGNDGFRVLFKGEKTKIRPLAQKGFWTLIKEI